MKIYFKSYHANANGTINISYFDTQLNNWVWATFYELTGGSLSGHGGKWLIHAFDGYIERIA